MNKKSIVLVAVIFAALTFFPSSAMAAENLITNGSFEVGGGEGSLIVGYAGGSTFPGWNVTLGGIERELYMLSKRGRLTMEFGVIMARQNFGSPCSPSCFCSVVSGQGWRSTRARGG